MVRALILKAQTHSKAQPTATNVLVKEKTREAVRRLLKNQVPENSPTFKQIGNHVLVGVQASTR
jgi:hypothetical protein